MASSSSSPFSFNLNLPSATATTSTATTRPLCRIHTSNFKFFCCNKTIQLETQQIIPKRKNQRKPRPSFSDQVLEKWSRKPTSLGEKFPWQKEDKRQQERKISTKFVEVEERVLDEPSIDSNSFVDESATFDSIKPVKLAPWVQKTKPQKQNFDLEDENSRNDSDGDKTDEEIVFSESRADSNSFPRDSDGKITTIDGPSVQKRTLERVFVRDNERAPHNGEESHSIERAPWERGKDLFQSNSNTPMADKLIPEFELKRLRNKAGRMVERFRVGAAGITQELVDSIHEKWKNDEVVKLKFKGPSAMNMKRIHESLESRTGGLVIFRSGSSVVLFRGMAYKLPCVQSFKEQKITDTENKSQMNYQKQYIKDLTEEELLDLKEMNLLLDGLGPRFKDWSGREPLPIDADLLPSIVEGYKRPFRLLPYGTKPGLRDKEMTFFRRTARTMPPHFALETEIWKDLRLQ